MSGSRISGDGAWVAYELRHTSTIDAAPTLYLLRLDTGESWEVPNGTRAEFSDDSRWIAYYVEPPASTHGRAGEGGTSSPRSAERRSLTTGAVRSWESIQSFTFAPGSSHLLLRRRGERDAGHAGADGILHDLVTERDLLLGGMNDAAFNSDGSLLAYTVDAAKPDVNGLFVFDLRAGQITAMDNDARHYSQLTWNEEGAALAALKGLPVDGQRERENALVAFRDVRGAMEPNAQIQVQQSDSGGRWSGNRGTIGGAAVTLDPTTAPGFPEDWVLSERRNLQWSKDGRLLFLGIKPQVPAPDTAARRQSEVADVDVWHSRDVRIQSMQMARAENDLDFTYLASYNLDTERFIQLADSTLRNVNLTADGRWAVGRDERAFLHDHERAAADLYRVDPSTGDRTLMLRAQLTSTSTGTHTFGTSPDGRYFLYWRDAQFHAYDLDAGSSSPITQSSPVSFLDAEFDHPGPRPPYGVAGYTSDGESVILQHRYDLWLVPLDGTGTVRNLTRGVGTENEIRFRLVPEEPGRGRLADLDTEVDLTRPVLLSAYGQWTKKSGFFKLDGGEMEELVFEDAMFGSPIKASHADRYLFTRQTFRDFPDLLVAGPRFAERRKVTDVNPHQAEYAWGHRLLFDFENDDGVRLQGILGIPDDYTPGERRPMIVNFYEKNSQNLHRHLTPSYMSSLGSIPMEAVSRGFLIMQPDIHFRTGASHSDMLECVEAAVSKVIEMGYADPQRIGLHGHSYSGQGAAFVGTRSRMFAAVGMGAGVTDMTSDFSHNWGWSYQIGGRGANAFDYYLYAQGRQGTDPWRDPELYRFESGRTHIPDAIAPFLIVHGTADPTVAFQEALGFYNAMRYHGKEAIMLAYPGEGHSIQRLANRRDMTIRYFHFFEHYLREAPAPRWMTDGISFLEKDGTRDPWED